MRREGIEIQLRAILSVAEDTEQLLVVVMCFLPLYIFIWAYSDTVNRWREEAMWNYTVEWAAMNLQRCQFQTRNIQSGEYFCERKWLFEKSQWNETECRERRRCSKWRLDAVFSSENWKQTSSRKLLWRAPFRHNCDKLSLFYKSSRLHFYHRFWIIAVEAILKGIMPFRLRNTGQMFFSN